MGMEKSYFISTNFIFSVLSPPQHTYAQLALVLLFEISFGRVRFSFGWRASKQQNEEQMKKKMMILVQQVTPVIVVMK